MERGIRRIIKLFIVILSVLYVSELKAVTLEKIYALPLHLDVSLGVGTEHKSILPMQMDLDLNYTLFKRLTIHANSQASYFMQKDGVSVNYNKATNLGGGLGYIFMRKDIENPGDFEIRVNASTCIGHTEFKNTQYSAGIHWHVCMQPYLKRLIPTIGVGYMFCDFSNPSIPNYSGLFASIGIRF